MSGSTGNGPRRPPRERFAGAHHLFDLGTEAARLQQEAGGARHGHRQITLFREGQTSVVLFDFAADGWLKDHAADGHVTIHVLSGEIRMSTPDAEYTMPAGSLLVLKPSVRHDVRAIQPSRMLLTVHLDADVD